jgi:hypothetical protein
MTNLALNKTGKGLSIKELVVLDRTLSTKSLRISSRHFLEVFPGIMDIMGITGITGIVKILEGTFRKM